MKLNFTSKLEKYAAFGILISAVIGGIIFGYVAAQTRNFSGIDNIKRFQPIVPTKLYDVNGELIAELFREKRELVSFNDLPVSVINAFLATEDKDFYRHIGINPVAIFRAFLKNIAAGRIVQGGSTITQQLAKRVFTKSQKTIARKALEAVFALQIEKVFSKEEILEMYFNQIYFGHGCYGIASAAKFFFNKNIKDLNLAESSVLAALPSAPTRYSPFLNTHNAYEKNRDILNRMVEVGFITQEKAEEIYETFWPEFIDAIREEYPTRTAYTGYRDNAPYFTDYVRQMLISRFGKEFIYNDGLNVYTTLDMKRQSAAQKYLTGGLEKQNEISSASNRYTSSTVDKELFRVYDTLGSIFILPVPKVKNDVESHFNKILIEDIVDEMDILAFLADAGECIKAAEKYRSNATEISSVLKVEGAMVAIEPSSGYITTMVGGSGFSVDNQYNRAVQARRQVGSAFKPFVYGAGIDSKLINAAMTLPDAPILDINEEGETWSPGNYKDNFSGLVSLRQALARSINIISIRIFDILGPDIIIDYAQKILRVPKSRFPSTPSLALGVCELTPFELARGYAVYANRGKDVIPFPVRYVTDKDGNEIANIEEETGNIVAQRELDGTLQVIPEEVAFIMTSMLQSVVNNGTAYNALRVGAEFTAPCAGKTGTTSNWTDAWFCGFTPDVTAVVWVGYDRPFMSLGKHQAGAVVAAPIWARYMKDITGNREKKDFGDPPPNVYMTEVCSYTGLLPSPTCLETHAEYMIPDGAPTEVCSGNHVKMKSVLDRYIEKKDLKINNE